MVPVHIRPIAATTWQELGRLVQSRLERRFPEGSADLFAPWGAVSLERAARSLATAEDPGAHTVGIATGFCVTSAAPLAAETDGPPAALLLAGVLRALGVRVVLLSDLYGAPLLRAGAQHCQLTGVEIAECPLLGGDLAGGDLDSNQSGEETQRWYEEFLSGEAGRRLTHLVSIERAGPSHTAASIRQQTSDDTIIRRFAETVPEDNHGRYHNMRGEVIDRATAPLDRLFSMIGQQRLPITTIGIGDGGNEIGLGAVPWQLLSGLNNAGEAHETDPADQANLLARVACRVATDHTIVAGVSNWGGFALAMAVAAMRGLSAIAVADAVGRQHDLVETLVGSAGAVDGFSGRREPLVDGLDRDEHLSPLWQMHDRLFVER
jgi:hypothetical protein